MTKDGVAARGFASAVAEEILTPESGTFEPARVLICSSERAKMFPAPMRDWQFEVHPNRTSDATADTRPNRITLRLVRHLPSWLLTYNWTKLGSEATCRVSESDMCG